MIELLCTDYNKKATSIHYYFGNAVLECIWNVQMVPFIYGFSQYRLDGGEQF